jgi:hypothetical protein
MKFIVILLLCIMLDSFTILNTYGIFHFNVLKGYQVFASSNSSNISKKNESTSKSIENSALSKINNNKMKGLLIVKILVNNKNMGNKAPSNFIIKIHANDPSIVSFAGNSSGTNVKLGMGMYSVSESIIPGYFALYSAECFGGMMTIDVKHCIITNTYSPPTSSISK